MGWFIAGAATALIVWHLLRDTMRVRKANAEKWAEEAARASEDDRPSYSWRAAEASRGREKLEKWKATPLLILCAGAVMGIYTNHREAVETHERLVAYEEGWDLGWNDACQEMFFRFSSTGDMYRGNTKYTFDWCISLRSRASANFYDPDLSLYAYDAGSAESDGRNDGYHDAVLRVLPVPEYLCYGPDCISSEDLFI